MADGGLRHFHLKRELLNRTSSTSDPVSPLLVMLTLAFVCRTMRGGAPTGGRAGATPALSRVPLRPPRSELESSANAKVLLRLSHDTD